MAGNMIWFLFSQCLLIHLVSSFDFKSIDTFRPKPIEKLQSVQNILNIPLESLNSFSGSRNLTAESVLLSENCTEAYQNFSSSLIMFTMCSIWYARPIHICMECGQTHSDFIKSYQDLKKQGGDCQSFFFSSDQLGIVDKVFNNNNNLWVNSYCQNCYDYYNETERFFQAANDLETCINNSNKSEILSANSTCEKCHGAYANVSASYNKFVHWKKEFVGGICMDVVDTMNISRRMWSEYNCAVEFDTVMGFPNVLTCLTVGMTPIMFYLLGRNISRLEDVKLVRPKRKFTTAQAPPQE